MTDAGRKSAADGRPILSVGRNCCTVSAIDRAAVLVDASEYYRRLEQVLRSARRSIWIVGWDLDASIKLRPGGSGTQALGDFLRELVDSNPELEIRLLVWNLATVHTPSAALPLIVGDDWQKHPRIHLRLDTRHPFYASQHQKIVCVDGSIGFVGGIDLTVMRWDTSAHAPFDDRRRMPDGTPYGPVHDLHMIVEGAAVVTILDIARERWRVATGETVPEEIYRDGDLWPRDLAPDFVKTEVGVSRTRPPWANGGGIKEVAALNLDALSAARRSIYIEIQYLADRRIGDILARHLTNPDGPEVVVLVTRITHGKLERWIMGGNRRRIIRRLRRADRFNRFRAFFPVVGDGDEQCEILLHSKLIIVDDRFIRIGSSNLNRRSTGLDTECDLAIEDADERTSASIADVRNRLLAEHLGTSPDVVARTIVSEDSLVRAIDKLNRGTRRLESYSGDTGDGPTGLIPGSQLLDPREPFRFASWLSRFLRLPYSLGGTLSVLRNLVSIRAKSGPPTASGRRK